MAGRSFRLIDLTLLDAPGHAARTVIDDVALESLADSIRALGIQEPLIVAPRDGGRYEVIAGHRRLLAGRMAQIARAPCLIETDPELVSAIRIHENLEREDLNAADEAQFYAELYARLGEDVDQVAATVRKSRGHVENRLLLLRGSTEVLEALRAGRITIGVAAELNSMKRTEDTAYYLEYALRGGASVRIAREWKAQANARAELAEKAAAAELGPGGASGPPPAPPPAGVSYAALARPNELTSSTEMVECLFCRERNEMWRTYRRYVCAPCADRHLVPAELEQQRMGR